MTPQEAIARGLERKRTIQAPTAQPRAMMLADIAIQSLVAAGYKIVPSTDRLQRPAERDDDG